MSLYKIEKFEKIRLNGIQGYSYEVFKKIEDSTGYYFYGSFFAKTKKEARNRFLISKNPKDIVGLRIT